VKREYFTFHKLVKIESLARGVLVHADFEQSRANLFDYLAAGETGLLCKTSNRSECIEALGTVMRGDAYINQHIKAQMLKSRWNSSEKVLQTIKHK
jgi:DNA-binding NarL/FixJ family response regulator